MRRSCWQPLGRPEPISGARTWVRVCVSCVQPQAGPNRVMSFTASIQKGWWIRKRGSSHSRGSRFIHLACLSACTSLHTHCESGKSGSGSCGENKGDRGMKRSSCGLPAGWVTTDPERDDGSTDDPPGIAGTVRMDIEPVLPAGWATTGLGHHDGSTDDLRGMTDTVQMDNKPVWIDSRRVDSVAMFKDPFRMKHVFRNALSGGVLGTYRGGPLQSVAAMAEVAGLSLAFYDIVEINDDETSLVRKTASSLLENTHPLRGARDPGGPRLTQEAREAGLP